VRALLDLAIKLTDATSINLSITHGLSGSGKSTVSRSLMQNPGAIRIRSDIERKRMAGLDALAKSGSGIGEKLYSSDTTRQTYARLAELAGQLLDAGWPVIVDATFLARWQRDALREAAHARNITLRILDFPVPLDILRQRILQRSKAGNDASEADLAVLQHQINTEDPLARDELAAVINCAG
jgi:predicted kinase